MDQTPTPQQTQQLTIMDLIYHNAYATIIALSATHANCGLPGVQTEFRTRQAEEFIEGRQYLTVLPDWFDELSHSTYNSRAWTMQEMMLSPRRILMSTSQVCFVCNSGVSWESIDDSSDPANYLGSLENPYSKFVNRVGFFSCLTLYSC